MNDPMMDAFHTAASATMRENGYKFDQEAIAAGVHAVAQAALYKIADEYANGHQANVPSGLDMRVKLPKWIADYADRHYASESLNNSKGAGDE